MADQNGVQIDFNNNEENVAPNVGAAQEGAAPRVKKDWEAETAAERVARRAKYRARH